MSYNACLNLLEGYRLLRGSHVVLLGGDMDFKIVDDFVMGLETGFTLVLTRECEWLGGAGALREPMDSNRSFPVMSTLRIVLAAFEVLRHMLDF